MKGNLNLFGLKKNIQQKSVSYDKLHHKPLNKWLETFPLKSGTGRIHQLLQLLLLLVL